MGKWDNASSVVATVRNSHAMTSKIVKRYGLYDLDADGGDDPMKVPDSVPDFVGLAWRDWAPLERWNRYKQVYVPDHGLTSELVMSGSTDVLSSVDLGSLPHPDPLYVFAKGIDLIHTDGKPGRMIGFHVSGSIRAEGAPTGRISSTHHPNVNGLHLMAICEVGDDRGRITDWDHCHLTLPFMQKFTIDELVSNCMQTFAGYSVPNDATEKYLAFLCRVMLPHILYTVASNVELAAERSATTALPRNTLLGNRTFKPVKLTPMGMRIGAALTNWRKPTTRKSAGEVTGGTVAPHMRRAHFHTYWRNTADGGKVSELRFLSPIPVKMKDGRLPTPTVHPVKTPREVTDG